MRAGLADQPMPLFSIRPLTPSGELFSQTAKSSASFGWRLLERTAVVEPPQ